MQHSLNYSSTSDGSPQTKQRRGRQRGRQRERGGKGEGTTSREEKRKHGGTEVQTAGWRRGSKGELGRRMKEKKRRKSNKKKGK